MPTKRYSVGVAELNGKIYVAGGHSLSEYLTKLEMYDPATDTWTILPPMMTPRSEFALVASNGKLYAIGGHYYGSQGQPEQWLNTVESYDPVSGIWSTKASMPVGLGMHGAVALDNGHIYVFGGRNTAILNTVMKYDPEANSWSPSGTMPNSRYNFGIAKVTGSNFYLVGGNTTINANYPANLTERSTVVSPWTLMFYIAADNSLKNFIIPTMKGLRQQAAVNPKVQVVVILDQPAQGTTYYWLKGDPNLPFVEGENSWYQGNLDMGDPATVVNFVNLAKRVFPAEHYALIFDDHGMGVTGAMTDDSSPRDSDGNQSFLTLSEIRQAMDTITEQGIKKIDVLFFYACYMGMLEPAYEVRSFTDYFVASEARAFGSYKIYPNFISQVVAATTPEQLAVKFVNDYAESMVEEGKPPWTMSAARMSKLTTLADATSALALNLMAEMQGSFKEPLSNVSGSRQESNLKSLIIVNKIQAIRNAIQKLDYGENIIDLYDFARRVKNEFEDSLTKAAAQSVMDAIKGYVIAEGHLSDESFHTFDNVHGVSIWFPKNSSSFYRGQFLQFAEDTQWETPTPTQLGQGGPAWGSFLVQFIKATNPNGEDISQPPPLLPKEPIGIYLYLPLILR